MFNDSSLPYANLANLALIEETYHRFLEDPSSVDPSWVFFFQGMEMASSLAKLPFHKEVGCEKEKTIAPLIEAYRRYGHLSALTNPLSIERRPNPYLDLQRWGFTKEDMEKEFDTCFLLSKKTEKLSLIIERLEEIYCSSIGVETAHLEEDIKKKVCSFLEKEGARLLSQEEKREILGLLNRSEMFEAFIHRKHPGQKRFSLEGGESMLPMMHTLIRKASELFVFECVIGMAHRGRLNLLTNLMGKSYADVFEEFSARYIPPASEGSGDVKYHKGYVCDFSAKGDKKVRVELCPNPSHLESVDPVLEGIVRAKQIQSSDVRGVLPLMIHGDASIAGQGVVYEVLQMSKLEGYSTFGTIHLVINNQVGFTASSSEGRSTRYCTDIAKGFNAPIFHVNGDDPEALVSVAHLAVELRQEFGCDVFIDLICYRKYGHSEGDEPMFTQPLLYKEIQNKENVRNLYKAKLLKEGVISLQQASDLEAEFVRVLEEASAAVDKILQQPRSQSEQKSTPIKEVSPKGLTYDQLLELTKTFCQMPGDLAINSKVQKLFADRYAAVESKQGIDWGLAEHLAFASLLKEGVRVRVSGQDCRRGTFAHRHAVVVDQHSERKYFPLSQVEKEEGLFTVYNSFLSEYGVLGFEYGYARAMPHGLTIWEAQFGDFANGAQIIIDQYIASSEQKWGERSPVVLMLPHGYEGQGPEHTSARLERFLQLCAQSNMKVVMPSKPSQVFHVLREQVHHQEQRPLILFMPKALLRYAPSLSVASEFTDSFFQKMIADKEHMEAKKLLLCSGKVYYDLNEERAKRKATDVAIIRIEQLYPFDANLFQSIISQYSKANYVFWVQEEHENMGAYQYIAPLLTENLPVNLKLCYVGRAASASPAAGSSALHQKEKEHFLNQAFGEDHHK